MMHERSTEIAPRATIGQLVGIRDRALALFAEVVRQADHLNEIVKPLNDQPYRLPAATVTIDRHSYGSTGIDAYRRKLDAGAWDHLMARTELRDLMSAKQREAWRRQLEEDPPEFTLETAVATFEAARADAPRIFRQGLIDVFEALPRDFRSHDGFKIGARCVMQSAVSHWAGRASWMISSYFEPRARVADLDRTFHMLAGIEWTSKIADEAAAAMEAGRSEIESRFFRLRWFANGNLHVWFLDKEMTGRANRLLAEHYGPALGKMHLHPDQRRW